MPTSLRQWALVSVLDLDNTVRFAGDTKTGSEEAVPILPSACAEPDEMHAHLHASNSVVVISL